MKRQDGNGQKMNPNVAKRVKKLMIILNIIYCVLLLIVFGPMPWNNNIFTRTWDYIALIIVVIYMLLLEYVAKKLLIKLFEDEEKSKELVEMKLSSNEFTKVFPNDVPRRYYNFFEEDESVLAEFFAKLEPDNKKVSIYVKMKDKNEYRLFEQVDKECFTMVYSFYC